MRETRDGTGLSIEPSAGGEKYFSWRRFLGFNACADDGKMTQNRVLPVAAAPLPLCAAQGTGLG
jgi:hypothetical protein